MLISEPRLNDDLRTACADLGFFPTQPGRLKLVILGVHTAHTLADKLDGFDLEEVGRLSAILRSALDPSTASEVEHLLWPAKIADAELPSFIVPIRPEFAQHLFDEHLAKQSLFGADVDLALNPESVYYRSACPRILEYPGRILWYVSKKGKFSGTMSIRACSRIAEVCIGKPKPLFKRFQRLGVYEWADVIGAAHQDFERDIMAVRFHDTELLPPVGIGRTSRKCLDGTTFGRNLNHLPESRQPCSMKSTLLLSIRPRFADGILAGIKRVELHRRLPRVGAEDTVVIYATAPTAAVVGVFKVESVQRLPIGPLWRQVRDIAGVTRSEYLDYFAGLADGVGIFISDAVPFSRPLPLGELRRLWPGFHPPQGFRYLDEKAMELLRPVSLERPAAA